MKRVFSVLCVVVFTLGCGDTANNSNNSNPDVRPADIAALAGDTAAGKMEYDNRCVTCHAADGSGVDGLGNDLTVSTFNKDNTIEILLNGKPDSVPSMASYASLSDQQLADITAYTMTFFPQ